MPRSATVPSSFAPTALCAIVLCSTRAATGCRSAWYVSRRPTGDVPLTNLSQLPPQVDSVLHADVQTLPADWSVHMCGVTREQHTPAAIRHCLTRHVGKAGDPVRAVHAVVPAVNPDERVADVLQGGLIGAV